MTNSNRQYDDDIFTLKEDEDARRRAHLVQYVLICAFAVMVLGVALYMSFYLTNSRLVYQAGIAKEAEITADDDMPTQTDKDPNYWPADIFPQVPQIESSIYDTRIDPDRAGKVEVNMTMQAASKFETYAEKLADSGGRIFVKTPRMTVVAYQDVEIHLLYGSTKNAAVLCNEPTVDFDATGYEAFPLPTTGRLVEVLDGTGEASRVLTYRLASSTDALNYCAQLTASGWFINGALEMQDQVFACSLRKEGAEGRPGMQVSIDYFSGSDNYRIRFDFIQAPTPAPIS